MNQSNTIMFEVCVIIPVYNAGRFVSRAVDSALQFPYVSEVLLIEDGSKDNSLEVCLSLVQQYPERVKLLQHEGGVNRGAGETRNLGLQNAQAAFISFLDADDYYLPNRFQKDIEIFSKYPDADGVYNAIGAHFENAEVKEVFQKQGLSEITTVSSSTTPSELKDVLLGLHTNIKGYFHLNALTLKRQTAMKVGRFNSGLKLHQDTEWIVKIAFSFKLYSGEIDNPVAVRTVHPENRITRFSSIKSRALLYYHQFKWIKTIEVDQKYTDHIWYRFIKHHLMAETSLMKRWKNGIGLVVSEGRVFDLRTWSIVMRAFLKSK